MNKSGNRRMAYLVSQYPSASHTFILREVLGLRGLGWDIDVASINADARSADRVTEEEVDEQKRTSIIKQMGIKFALLSHLNTLRAHPVAYLKALKFLFTLQSTGLKQSVWKLFYLTEAVMLGQWMKQKDQTHLHVHFATAAASVAMLTRTLFPITLSMTVHGPDELCDVKGQWFREKIHTCDMVVCISHFARSQVMYHSDHAHWHKAVVCRLGVTAPWLGMASQRLDQPLKPARKLDMLCVGRLTPAKGQRQLVDAVEQLTRDGYDISLSLIGDGPDRPALEQAIAKHNLGDRVHLLGLKNQIEVRQAMQKADVFALPSFAEGVPVALMEAMAAGVPALSTRIAGIAELISPRQTGCLIHAGDSAGLVSELAWLANNPDSRWRMSVEAEKFVRAQFNLDLNIPKLSGIFENFLQGTPSCVSSKPLYAAC